MKGIIGRKVGMTQLLTRGGEVVPVTVIEAGPCFVTQIKTADTDGYGAIQLGFGETRLKRLTKGVQGHLKRHGLPALRILREVRLKNVEDYEVGQKLQADIFASGERVDVIGTSKGKGYQGVMKKHKMGGNRATHGTHEFFRHGGSIGCRLTPGRVHKGKRMGGHMGDERRTVQNLKVVEVLAEKNVLLIEGSIPGGKNGYVVIRGAVKRKNKQPQA